VISKVWFSRRAHALLLASILALGVGCASRSTTPAAGAAAPPSAPARPASAELPLDPAVTAGELGNGLRYFIRTNRKPENRAEIWLAVDAGSVLEDDAQQGLAHFVEHMAFNGTRNFAKQDLVDYLESIGMRFGPDLNAYTTFDQTVYMLRLPTDDEEILTRGFLILEDWAHGISFEDEEIDKERGVVLEEWRLGRGAQARMRDRHFPVLFKDSRYAARLPIGKEEVLQNAPYEELRRFYRDWYRPDLMAVIAVGDFDADRIEALIHQHFAGLEGPEEARPRETYPVPDHDETLVSVATDPEATNTQVSVYYKLEKRENRTAADYRRSLVEALYHAMLNARLDELRQAPDPPFLFGFSTSGSFVRSRDIYFQTASVEEHGVERGLDALLVEVERVDRHGFTATELERLKIDTLRRYERAYEERDKRNSARFAGELLGYFLSGTSAPGIEVELELLREMLPGIGLDEVNDLARDWIGERNRVIVFSGPEKEDLTPPTDAELLAVFSAAESKTVEPYVDQVREEPLLAELPEPGRIVERGSVDEIGVTEWRLSNGVRVIMKPTDFKNDEIQLGGFSPGGTSLVEDERFTSATFSPTVLRTGGLGKFDRIELEKALAGKVASASVSLGELEERARGGASPQDAETMFQLLYLGFTAPRRDDEAFASWLTRSEAAIENREANPSTVFSDAFGVAYSQGHFRRRPLTKERLTEIDLGAALDVPRERFGDAGDFTFVLVGNFEPDEIEPLVLRYLGGLPSAGRQESWRDVGVRPPGEIVEVEVLKGLEPKSRVRITFHGDAEWTPQAAHDIGSLAQLMRIRLREVLREDMGGTYGVGVSGRIAQRPLERFGLTVSFGCAPENLEELIAAVFDEIESLKSRDVEQSYVDKVQEAQTRKRETDLEENGFWRGVLTSYYRDGRDPRLILDYDRLVRSVTPERMRAAANRYLDTERYVIGRLLPEATPGAVEAP
jgi:zinc protease